MRRVRTSFFRCAVFGFVRWVPRHGEASWRMAFSGSLVDGGRRRRRRRRGLLGILVLAAEEYLLRRRIGRRRVGPTPSAAATNRPPTPDARAISRIRCDATAKRLRRRRRRRRSSKTSDR